MNRNSAGVVVAAAALLALAACSSGSGSVPPPPFTGPSVTVTATPEPAPQPIPQPAPPPTPPPAPPSRCRTGELAASLGPADAGAGSVYLSVVFTNKGTRSCELAGFPGVSYVTGDDGHQVGPAAARSGPGGAVVALRPGAAAAAKLQLANVHNFDDAACGYTPVRGLRIYPPDETSALFLPYETTGCAKTPPGPSEQLQVQAVAAQ